MSPYIGLSSSSRKVSESASETCTPEPLMSRRCRQTFLGGFRVTWRLGVLMPRARMCCSTSRKGKPLRKAPLTSHDYSG